MKQHLTDQKVREGYALLLDMRIWKFEPVVGLRYTSIIFYQFN